MIKEVVELILQSSRFFALTGAGVSTDSGIPDFRSPGTGLWQTSDAIKYSNADALVNEPLLFWQHGFNRFKKLIGAAPNRAHYMLLELEKMGYLTGLITQNIDNLHYLAGSRRLYEIHGHIRTCRCTCCTSRFPFNELILQLDKGIVPPACQHCSQPLRPDIVLFGDSMPDDFYSAHEQLYLGCDLMLVAGSSLTVYPAASLPLLAKNIVIINLQPTPIDNRARLVLRENVGSALEAIVCELKDRQ